MRHLEALPDKGTREVETTISRILEHLQNAELELGQAMGNLRTIAGPGTIAASNHYEISNAQTKVHTILESLREYYK